MGILQRAKPLKLYRTQGVLLCIIRPHTCGFNSSSTIITGLVAKSVQQLLLLVPQFERANAIVLHTRGLNSTQRANAPSDSHQTTRVAGTCRDTPRTKRVHGVTGSYFPFSMTLSFPAMVPGHGRRRSKLQSSPFSPAKGPP